MISNNDFCLCVGEYAMKSVLFEVSAVPKPGLVDRNNSGAHSDMDFFSFMSSSAAIAYIFYECALKGVEFNSSNYCELLNRIRPIGIEGEKRMLVATNGVNTHKGLVFSLGIISAVAGSLYRENKKPLISSEEVCNRVEELTSGITDRELKGLNKNQELTNGEKLYVKYGIKGIRGEVESGFKTVRKFALPKIKEYFAKGKSINDTLVQVLFHLMSETDDSNVLGRHDMKTLNYIKKRADIALGLGGIFTKEGRRYIEEMDEDFIEKNISPGGSADLLAVTIMLYLLESKKISFA